MDTFQLRFVCTANLCRSPLAERIAVLRVPHATTRWLAVSSAGTHARDGMRMHPPAARHLGGVGADPAGFRSRRLTAAMVAGDDLVLTADLAQRDAVVALCPAASRRTFMIKEFARLVRHPPVLLKRPASWPPGGAAPGTAAGCERAEAAREMVAHAARYRGRVPWCEPVLDEIADPDGTDAAVASCAEQIDLAVTEIVLFLAGPTPPPASPTMRAADSRS
ncbi:arsenate reductase/protein-tyrosine-phosphatase family protein [Streptacidiphilus melanogenes]|uniref:arsenate reductase/protein-tyrosine-phosphatase family protein n=1 Tax=Streptacidiphilus melanogenes TaxID=411235 RepID=UPI0005A60FF3|nr:hypothetical protein [Streptacidiphilus melanogenes]